MLQLIDQMLVSGLRWEGSGSVRRVHVSWGGGVRGAGCGVLCDWDSKVIGKRESFLPDWWVWDCVGLTSCDWLFKKKKRRL